MIAINVYSPKGGVGTTTIASMLALDITKFHYVGLISKDPDSNCSALGYPSSVMPYKVSHALTVSNELIPDVDFTVMDSRAHMAAADLNILVVQNTYMCLRKALNCKFDLIVVNMIPGSALGLDDIRSVTGYDDNEAIMNWDAQGARTLDAGLAGNFLKREDFRVLAKLVDETIKQDASF